MSYPDYDTPRLRGVLAEVHAERARQDAKWGEQNHPDGTGLNDGQRELARHAKAACQQAFAEGHGTWAHVLMEEVREAFAESDPAKLRTELAQVAAVAVAWIEAIDRRAARPASIVELLAAVAQQLPPDDPAKCAETLAAMDRRAADRRAGEPQ